MRTALATTAMLAILALLSACTPKVVTRTDTVKVPVYTQVKVPAELTDPISAPLPIPACEKDGKPVYCNGQLIQIIDSLREALERANADRATIKATQ